MAEAYPDLKASQNFQDLQRNLVEIENNDPVRSPVLQRRGARLEHAGREHPVGLGRRGSRLRRAALLPARRRRRARRAPGGVRVVVGPRRQQRKRRRQAQASRVETEKDGGRRADDLIRFTGRLPVWTCLLVAIVANGLAAAPRGAIPAGRSRSFDVTLAVRPDAALDVTELIDADFQVPKHGIYREIPIRYAVGMQQYALRFRLLGVDDGAGKSYGTAVSLRGESGSDPDRRARLRRSAVPSDIASATASKRAILWEGTRAWGTEEGNRDHAVLRWNATGTEWGVPIRRSTVTVKLPRRARRLSGHLRRLDRGLRCQGQGLHQAAGRCADDRFRDRGAAKRRRDHRRGDDARRRGLPAWLDERGRRVAGRQLPLRDLPRDIGRSALPPGSTAAATSRAGARSSSTTSLPMDSRRPRSAR